MDYFAPLRSDLKQKILLSLLNGEKKIAELTADVGTRETSILHVLKEFEALNLTTKFGGTYKLTSLGIIDAQICKECYTATEVIEKFRDFWLSHDISPIPPHLILRTGALKDSSLIKTETSELGKVHQTFLQVLMSSKGVKGSSPIFHSDFVEVFKQLLNQGEPVELVLTSAVLEKTLATAESELLKKYIAEGRLKIYLKDDLKVALTVTESAFSLGLYTLNSEYDYNMDLVSFSQDAILWGNELFQECVKGSRRIGLDTAN